MHLPRPDLYVILHWRLDGNWLCDVAYNDAVYALKFKIWGEKMPLYGSYTDYIILYGLAISHKQVFSPNICTMANVILILHRFSKQEFNIVLHFRHNIVCFVQFSQWN